MNFESVSEIEKRREDLRRARHLHLEKAKKDYEKEEKKKERAKARGEDTWMLASVNQRLEQEQMSLKKTKKKKDKKKSKKKKRRQSSSSSDSESDSEEEKRKKRSKKKKKRRKDSSSSSSNSDEASQWVEKSASEDSKSETSAVRGPKLERDSWMSAPIDLFASVTRQDLMNRQKKEKEEQDRVKNLLDKPGTHAKEMNPYWKDGGTGLPDEKPEGKKERIEGKERVGDAGLSWLQKSYERCVEQAKEEGRSLEELAAERWGSLEKIQSMICDAEIAKFGRPRTGDQRKRFMKPTDSDHISDSRNSKSSSSGYNRKRSKSPERSRFQRPRSNSRERRDTSRSREKRCTRSRSRERRSRRRDRRSRSRERYRSRDYRSSTSSSLKGRFMKPGDLDNGDKRREASSSSNSKAPSWRKKEFQKPDEDKEEVKRENVDTPRERRRERRKSSSSSDSSSDSSSESTSEDERSKRKSPAMKQPPARILTEKEMNDLGAKIVKAEILGNEELAAKLKAQLESAREAKKTAPQGQVRVGGQDEEEEEVVTLTRTGRSGMARPVSEGEFPVESGGRRRRKKQTVETHTGKQGERTKYFDDDDKHDLKSLVEREKLGTAEDQNQMFARLAGRASERTDDDFQMDDLILSKADRKQSEAVQEQRDRAAAIFEHKKMGTAMDKCNFCFGKVSKHLIIAIGQKVYLSLPPHQSLTEGHCLIVPMQHVTSSTVVDEDVWSEIQLFRKTLTRMFTEKDEDVVFMETSMRLKHFPHMCIECVPIEKEVGDMAPIYFKKAIQDSESEWSQNKKVIELRHKDIRHSVPKGFPYFAVDFGNEGGFAHVIEDEQKFPHYFGREIIGGMVDADHRLWKKPPRENFDDQRRKVMKFSEMWKPYDWTQNIDKKVNEDSSSSSSDD